MLYQKMMARVLLCQHKLGSSPKDHYFSSHCELLAAEPHRAATDCTFYTKDLPPADQFQAPIWIWDQHEWNAFFRANFAKSTMEN